MSGFKGIIALDMQKYNTPKKIHNLIKDKTPKEMSDSCTVDNLLDMVKILGEIAPSHSLSKYDLSRFVLAKVGWMEKKGQFEEVV